MYETLLGPYDVQPTSTLPTLSEVSDKLKQSEIKREEKRLKRIASAHRGDQAPSHGEQRKRDGLEEETEDVEQVPVGGKRVKTEEEETDTTVQSQSATPKEAPMNEVERGMQVKPEKAFPPSAPVKLIWQR